MKQVIILFLSFIIYCQAYATHIVGGDIYYDYLGNNNYKFYINVYRDCNSTGAAYDDPLYLEVYNQANVSTHHIAVPFPGSVILPVIFNNPCVTPPSTICVEKAVYTTIITLPPIVGGYTISYQRCCRNPNIINLISPDNTGFTLTTHVPGLETGMYVNSSPRFTNYPPLLLCNNEQLIFNHAATDPDGDQLIYSLVTPNAGANSAVPAPTVAPPPPYPSVNWATTFTALNPLGPGASIQINPTTGLLTATPLLTGLFVVGIRVQEYRNGVLLGETVRDFLFTVFNCNITMQAILPLQTELATFVSYCQGLTIQFENDSYGGTNYAWDFGVAGTASDVSSSFAPTFTYPSDGIYTAQLIVNPGWPCTDTATMLVNVNNQLQTSFVTLDSICFINNSFDFYSLTNNLIPVNVSWDFGPNAAIQYANTSNVLNQSFTTSGFIPIALSVSSGTCTDTYFDSIYIFPKAEAEIDIPTDIACLGLTVPFGNLSQHAYNYNWTFNSTPPIILSDTLPIVTLPNGGTYTVTLIANSTGLCSDTIVETFTVNELLSISYTSNDSLCITGNSFQFDGQMTGPSFTEFAWDFGTNATPQVSTLLDVSPVVFSTAGFHPITVSAFFDQCLVTYTDSVFVYSEPIANFTTEPGPFCAPDAVQFINLSTADAPLNYAWSFGDGASSLLQNPNHYYPNAGTYSIGLTIFATEGCTDTITLFQPDFVTLHPSPVAKFSVTPDYTDICNAAITFTDQSIGATSFFYWLDDESASKTLPSFDYTYLTSGYKRPMQVAINEFGCDDTAYRELFIEPFVIYFPNTFTPDKDEFNNEFNGTFALEMLNWNLKIMNRWGEVIFESNDAKVGWDGTYNGRLMQDGNYLYELNYVSCEKPQITQVVRGHVNLLR
jgi:gliding motility-associated-like protein